MELRPGDEIAVGLNRGGAIARMTLHPEIPTPGPHRVATNFGGHQWNPYTALGVNVDAIFRMADGREAPYKDANNSYERRAPDRAALLGADGKAGVDFVLANPLPIPVKLAYDCTVRSYFYEVAAREQGECVLEPHSRVVKTLKYEWKEAEPAYLAFASLRGINPPPCSAPRTEGGLGWPEHEVYHYFPGQRHALPWPDPYAFRTLRRLTLTRTDLGTHEVISLDQTHEWERALTTDLEPPMPPPEGLAFKKVRLP